MIDIHQYFSNLYKAIEVILQCWEYIEKICFLLFNSIILVDTQNATKIFIAVDMISLWFQVLKKLSYSLISESYLLLKISII